MHFSEIGFEKGLHYSGFDFHAFNRTRALKNATTTTKSFDARFDESGSVSGKRKSDSENVQKTPESGSTTPLKK